MSYSTLRLFNALAFLLLFTFSCQVADEKTTPATIVLEENPQASERIISLSGFLTEVLATIGYADQIIGRDVTSTTPADLTNKIPSLGHVSQLNAEAILALQPTTIFVEKAQLAQSEVFEQLEQAGIAIRAINTSQTLDNALKAAQQIGKSLEVKSNRVEKMRRSIVADSLQLAATIAEHDTKPKVLFIYARGAGRLMVSGTGTSAAAIIEKAGGRNAIESFENFKPLTPEALIEAAPDVILMFESGLASLNGKEGLEQITGISQTPAFQNNRIVAMDGHYLTAFGTKAAEAALELARHIHE
ncbi:MAG: ABC transporter substrate-binding protein [Bacteroidota bacterium]